MERKHERKMRDFKEEMNKKYQSQLKISMENLKQDSSSIKKLSTIKKEKKFTRGIDYEKE